MKHTCSIKHLQCAHKSIWPLIILCRVYSASKKFHNTMNILKWEDSQWLQFKMLATRQKLWRRSFFGVLYWRPWESCWVDDKKNILLKFEFCWRKFQPEMEIIPRPDEIKLNYFFHHFKALKRYTVKIFILSEMEKSWK